jgi:hypothetical protein
MIGALIYDVRLIAQEIFSPCPEISPSAHAFESSGIRGTEIELTSAAAREKIGIAIVV